MASQMIIAVAVVAIGLVCLGTGVSGASFQCEGTIANCTKMYSTMSDSCVQNQQLKDCIIGNYDKCSQNSMDQEVYYKTLSQINQACDYWDPAMASAGETVVCTPRCLTVLAVSFFMSILQFWKS